MLSTMFGIPPGKVQVWRTDPGAPYSGWVSQDPVQFWEPYINNLALEDNIFVIEINMVFIFNY